MKGRVVATVHHHDEDEEEEHVGIARHTCTWFDAMETCNDVAKWTAVGVLLVGTNGVDATTRGTRTVLRFGSMSQGAFIAALVVVGILLAALLGVGIYAYMEHLRRKQEERRRNASVALGMPVDHAVPVQSSMPD